MIETTVFVIGCVLGVFTVIVIQKLYNWIEGLSRRVKSLRWELEKLSMIKEDWTEFQFWKREQKENK